MYLTTGLASLAAFWLILYTFLFTLVRIWWSTPPDPKSTEFRHGLRRFLYRVSRAFLVVNSVLIPAVVLDCILKGISYRSDKKLTGTNGIGPGIAREYSSTSPVSRCVPWSLCLSTSTYTGFSHAHWSRAHTSQSFSSHSCAIYPRPSSRLAHPEAPPIAHS